MPILDKIELELNGNINESINVRNTINRYLQAVEHQVKWKKRYKNKLMLSCFMILAWYATICSNWITIRWFFPLFYHNLTQRCEEIIDHDCHWGCPELTWFNWIVLMPFINLFDYFVSVLFLFILVFFLMILQCLLSINYPLHLVLRCNTPAP